MGGSFPSPSPIPVGPIILVVPVHRGIWAHTLMIDVVDYRTGVGDCWQPLGGRGLLNVLSIV